MCIYAYLCVFVCMSVHMFLGEYVFLCVCEYVSVCMFVCVCREWECVYLCECVCVAGEGIQCLAQKRQECCIEPQQKPLISEGLCKCDLLHSACEEECVSQAAVLERLQTNTHSSHWVTADDN